MSRRMTFIAFAGLVITAMIIGCVEISVGDPDIDRALRGIGSAGKVAEAHQKANEDFTPEQAYYIGRAVGAELLTEFKLYDNEAATRYVNELGQTLGQFAQCPQEPYKGYRFILLDSDAINAFAAPGSFIFLTRGMLRVCDTEEELAAILAHEIAHIEHDHAVKAIKQSRGADFWKTLGTEIAKNAADRDQTQLTDTFSGMAGDAFKTLSVTGYSRESEQDADRSAVALLKRAGYPPSALVSMLQKMESKLRPGGLDFVKTHPRPVDRITTVQPLVGSAKPAAVESRQARFTKALSAARG